MNKYAHYICLYSSIISCAAAALCFFIQAYRTDKKWERILFAMLTFLDGIYALFVFSICHLMGLVDNWNKLVIPPDFAKYFNIVGPAVGYCFMFAFLYIEKITLLIYGGMWFSALGVLLLLVAVLPVRTDMGLHSSLVAALIGVSFRDFYEKGKWEPWVASLHMLGIVGKCFYEGALHKPTPPELPTIVDDAASVRELTDRVEALKKEGLEKDIKIESLQTEVARLEKSVQYLDNQVKQKKDLYELVQKQMENHTQTINELLKSNDDKEVGLMELKALKATLEFDKANKDFTIQSLKSTVERQSKTISDLESKVPG